MDRMHVARKPSEPFEEDSATVGQLRLLTALTAIQQRYLEESGSNLFAMLLDALLELTASEAGFLAELEPGGAQVLHVLAASPADPSALIERLGPTLRQGEAQNLPPAEGRPAALALPVHHRGRLTAVVALLRPGRAFPATMAEHLRPFLASCAAAVESQRNTEARRRAIDESLAANLRLTTLVENLQEGLLLESEERRIVMVSPRFCELFHIPAPPAMMVGMDCAAMAQDAKEAFVDPANFIARTEELLAARRLVRGDVLPLRDGRVFERDFVPMHVDGVYWGHYWQYREITARKRAEMALVSARDAAEQANRFKSDFLASMSHEIRTPMTAMVGYADMLLRSGGASMQWEDAIRQIRKNADYLLALVNDVLDLSKIEAGQLIVHLEPTQPSSILAAVGSMMRPLATEKCISLDVEIQGLVPAAWSTDPVRFRQILVNLVGNAIKFTEQGSVKITCTYEPLLKPEGGLAGWLQYAVRDTGIGIPEAKLPQLFSAFTQLHDTRRRRSGGTGLGLAICKRLTDALRGQLTVSSQAGRGSEFLLRLPVPEEEARRLIPGPSLSETPVEEPTPGRDPGLHGVRVLLVDDNPDNQRIVSFLLEHVGALVECADDGRMGVDRFFRDESPAFDVVLMDMQMPVLDGYGATSELRRRGATLPIIALTAYAMAGDAQRCLAAGCSAYLPKPIVPGDLYKVIRQQAGPRPARRAEVMPALRSALANPALLPLVTRFVQRLPERKNRMATALAAQATDELRVAIHSLRGTGASFGFPELSTLSGEAEDAIRTGASAEEVTQRTQTLLAAIDQALLQAAVAGIGKPAP
jgi:signal transduction histidine kinase